MSIRPAAETIPVVHPTAWSRRSRIDQVLEAGTAAPVQTSDVAELMKAMEATLLKKMDVLRMQNLSIIGTLAKGTPSPNTGTAAMIQMAMDLGDNKRFAEYTFSREFQTVIANSTEAQQKMWIEAISEHSPYVLRVMLAALVKNNFFITQEILNSAQDHIFLYKKAYGLA